MTSLLVELYDRHVLEKNVYQAFISDCDEILFLSLTKISNDEKLSLRQFILEEVPHIQRVSFRQLSLEQLANQLDYCLVGYDQVLLDVFGGDSLLALFLYQYGLDRDLPIVAMDVERGKQYKWVAGRLEKEDLDIPTLNIQQLIALRGGKLLKSKRPLHTPKQIAAIKKLASSAISNPAHWYQVTQFFSLAKTNDLHAETEKILENNGKYYHYPESLIPLLVEAGMLCMESEDKKRVTYSFPSQEAQVFCRNKGHILEVYLYLLALESQLFDECMIGGEIDWNGIFPEADNVQNEIDVILRKGRSITFISCKMTDLSVEAINELEVYANHFAGESCLKLIVCTGKINPVYANRCQEYGVLVIRSEQISNLIPMLKKYSKRQKR
ncbi:hypothetical protein [Streptococcus oralis]|uniref:DUF1887 domain-containing protein n=1 Tax=Streptococcus oralis subsp. tigurinus TaxID=1077464 RepID=A0A1X1GA67_STROR|nr:hypothetical protein [Streptococcus oralis]ORO43676.1 hypothetical protein B7727_06270 [Streptococcus oralis subsp. tigurinus]